MCLAEQSPSWHWAFEMQSALEALGVGYLLPIILIITPATHDPLVNFGSRGLVVLEIDLWICPLVVGFLKNQPLDYRRTGLPHDTLSPIDWRCKTSLRLAGLVSKRSVNSIRLLASLMEASVWSLRLSSICRSVLPPCCSWLEFGLGMVPCVPVSLCIHCWICPLSLDCPVASTARSHLQTLAPSRTPEAATTFCMKEVFH